jgi:hypothetical protein
MEPERLDRGNSKHGPRLDEQMEQETRGLTQGGPTDGRAEEWHEPEPSGEDQPDVGTGRSQMGGSPTGMTPEERDERSDLGRYLRRSVFPADRDALVAEARENQAPDGMVALLRRLPAGTTFQNVAEAWAAHMHASEEELEQRF